MNSKLVKGILLMLGPIFLALQSPDTVWAGVIITSICLGIGYFVKNYLMPSDAPEGQLGWKEIVSALILAVIAAVSASITDLVSSGTVNWGLLLKTVGTAVLTYITTTFFAGQKVSK